MKRPVNEGSKPALNVSQIDSSCYHSMLNMWSYSLKWGKDHNSIIIIKKQAANVLDRKKLERGNFSVANILGYRNPIRRQ